MFGGIFTYTFTIYFTNCYYYIKTTKCIGKYTIHGFHGDGHHYETLNVIYGTLHFI